jgi:hypothetical protein
LRKPEERVKCRQPAWVEVADDFIDVMDWQNVRTYPSFYSEGGLLKISANWARIRRFEDRKIPAVIFGWEIKIF